MHKHTLVFAFPLLLIIGTGCGQNLHKRATVFIDKECDCFNAANISLSDGAEKFLEYEDQHHAGLDLTDHYYDLSAELKEELREFAISVKDPRTKLGACLHKAEIDDEYWTPNDHEWSNYNAEKYYHELEKIINSRKNDCKWEYYSRRGLISAIYNKTEGK
jgi:hypothetical protein